MRLLRLVFLLSFALGLSHEAVAQTPDEIPVVKLKITENILLFKTGVTGVYPNMIALKSSQGVIVFDSHQFPEVAKKIRGMIEAEFRKPIVFLINTHGANDHTSGNFVFSDVPIIAHEEAKPEMANWAKRSKDPQIGARMQSMLQQMPKLKEGYPGDPKEVDDEIARTKMALEALKTPAEPATPSVLFPDRMTLHVGETTLLLYHNTPSYSRSDILIHIPRENVLIVGDVFNKNRLPWLNQTTDYEAMKALFAPFISDDSKACVFIGTHNLPLTRDEIKRTSVTSTRLGRKWPGGTGQAKPWLTSSKPYP